MKICEQKAIARVTWVNGKTVAMCATHEMAARKVAQVLGCTITITPIIEPGIKCECKVAEIKSVQEG